MSLAYTSDDRFMFRVRNYSRPSSFRKYFLDKIRKLKRKDFVVKTYSELSEEVKKTNENCSVCYDEFENSSKIHQTSCNHFFCVSCIEKWTQTNNYTCPLCRGHL
jgi:hypothetical protein